MLIYKKVYDYITKSWVERPFETDPSKVEIGTPTTEQLMAIGLVEGSTKTKSYSELTDEERKLFTDYYEEEDLDNDDN